MEYNSEFYIVYRERKSVTETKSISTNFSLIRCNIKVKSTEISESHMLNLVVKHARNTSLYNGTSRC